jgi:phospholipase A1
MLKFFLAVTAVVMLSIPGFSDDTVIASGPNPFSQYRFNYMIFGDNNDQVKMLVSIKYDLFQSLVPRLGFYIGYSQTMFWQLYDLQGPFEDIDFNPDFFWRFESKHNFINNVDIPLLDYIQFGFEHKSNGKGDDPDHHGFNRYYGQIELSAGHDVNIGLNVKVFSIVQLGAGDDLNPDIQNYIGSYEATVFLKTMDPGAKTFNEELLFTFASGGGIFGFDFTKGYQQLDLLIRPVLFFRPYIQLFHGYDESLINYDVESVGFMKSGIAARIGMALEIF